jgi:4'-phosphopantetheinyl transferase
VEEITGSITLQHIPEIKEDKIQIWVISGSDCNTAYAEILARLSPVERARARRFRSENHAARWAYFHACLRNILGGCCGREPQELEFRLSDRDKPSLRDAGTPPLHFNLSHSGELALLAVTRRAPVGVDIEHMRDLNDRDALAKRFFSQRERENYSRLPERERHRCFYQTWTRKEAVIKANGLGLAAPLDAFDVVANETTDWQSTRLRAPLAGGAAYPVYPLDPIDGYIGAVALEVADTPRRKLPEVLVYDYQPVF